VTRPGGLLLLDDMHKSAYRGQALERLERAGLVHYSLKKITRDRFSRYAYLVCP
jgi:hypothetical protein